MSQEQLEPMMVWFYAPSYLPHKAQTTNEWFGQVALKVTNELEPGPERTVCLRKLLEAKDAAMRATMQPGV